MPNKCSEQNKESHHIWKQKDKPSSLIRSAGHPSIYKLQCKYAAANEETDYYSSHDGPAPTDSAIPRMKGISNEVTRRHAAIVPHAKAVLESTVWLQALNFPQPSSNRLGNAARDIASADASRTAHRSAAINV